MKTIIFKNKGVIDPRSITTFGVSSKEGSNPIGFFGTGLKYAIAILLREGCGITIYSGAKKLEFGVKASKIRVDSFDIVTMNNKPLGFTTELGKTWELWQAVRELYCNCTDESGDIFTTTVPETQIAAGYTTIVVTGQKVEQVMDHINEYIIQSQPLHVLDGVEVHAGKSDYVFYKGVRIHKLSKPSLYTYNINGVHLDITEDRTLKYYWYAEYYIQKAIATATRFFPDILHAPDDRYEFRLDFSDQAKYSEEFLNGVAEAYRKYEKGLNKSAVVGLHKARPDSIPEPTRMTLTPLEAKRFVRAVDFLSSIGIDISGYPIIFTEFLGEGILGQAKNDKIYISRLPFNQGTKMLAGTIMEEYFHLKYKVEDCTYGMQNFLIDKIMTIGEQVTGEPL